jgi:hypothetical protein
LKRILRMLGLAMVVSALLVVSLTGAAFAANPDKGNGTNGPNGDCEGNGPIYDQGPFGPYGPYEAQNGIETE